MSEDLSARFQQASEAVKNLSQAPDSETMLKLYALFKQSTVGENTGKRPGMMDFVGKAKYDAWKELEGATSEEAMSRYVALVDSLIAADKK